MAMKTIVFKVGRSETTYALHVTSVIFICNIRMRMCKLVLHQFVGSNPDWVQPIRVSKLQ